jgi:hypothetical protein
MGTLGATSAYLPEAASPPPLYRPRNSRLTPLFQLFEAHHEDIKALWEERFENTHGRWRGFTESVVARYLDCASPE